MKSALAVMLVIAASAVGGGVLALLDPGPPTDNQLASLITLLTMLLNTVRAWWQAWQ